MKDWTSFIHLWNNSSSCEKVAAALNTSVDTVRHNATRLRKNGHYLKSMRLPELNSGELNTLAKQMFEGGEIEVTQREFIIIWQLSKSVSQVAKRTQLNEVACRARAREYRKLGISLKKFSKGRPRIKSSKPYRQWYRFHWVHDMLIAD